MTASSLAQGSPPGRGVYCNRTLNLRAIDVVGYDMDYTLVHYHVDDWERRAYEHIRGRLVADGWPVEDLRFDAELVVRGLVIDIELGNVLKANRFGFVKTACHGTRRMDFDELRQTYARTMIGLADPRYRFMNTLFALSECCLYAQLVDRLDAGGLPQPMGYDDLYDAVRSRSDATHTEGELKAEIIAAPEKYVDQDADTVMALLDQQRAGKRLLLITNSEWSYTLAMMKYAFDPFLPDGMSWRELFEVTVVAARKPAFFTSGAPLLRVTSDEGSLMPHVGPLEPHGCYYGGNASLLQAHLGVSGDEILYLGDHMYGDVRVTKNLLRWRTGLILRELEEELVAVEESTEIQAQLAALMADKEQLEYQHCQLRVAQLRSKGGYGPVHDEGGDYGRRLAKLRAASVALDEQISPLATMAGKAHNPCWGLMMRAGNDKSLLARQIERYADVYTSRVSNLLYATPFAYLRSRRGSLPHDP